MTARARQKLARFGATLYCNPVRFVSSASSALLATAVFVANLAHASPPDASRAVAVSFGAPNAGRLELGAHLDASATIRIVPSFANEDYRWGLPALVSMIVRAAGRVEQRFSGSLLSVGDISRKTGGELREHLSHQSGRDADLAFYALDIAGNPYLAQGLIEFDGDGRCKSLPSVRFDDLRNWTLLEALLSEPDVRVEQVFVSSEIRARLLREAEKRHVPLGIRMRASRVMREPRNTTEHADHFHIRIACPRGQRGVCESLPRRGDARNRSARTSNAAHSRRR